MQNIRDLWRNIFDVRPGERLRALFMFLYLVLVLFSYYILKPVSQAMFLNRFDVDDLPFLIILVAIGAGILAYVYSKAALRLSLSRAVTGTMGIAVASLIACWWLLAEGFPWMLYVFNIFVGVFGIVLVAQGWLVAGNVFNAREAKRVYPLLGMALVMGAALGGEFTRRTAALVGTRNLVFASAVLVVLAWLAFLLASMQKGVALSRARGAVEEEPLSVRGIAADISHSRHLQIIIAMMAMIFIVDVLINYQFSAMAKARYSGDQLTVFLGSFYGLWLNLTEFVVQFLVTSAVVGRFGVGGTLQVMPVSILLASIATVVAPGVLSTSAVRLTEACSRYTLNRTGMELLYMPLPRELRNRIKAFIDIFFDRMSRGVGGLLLILLTRVFHLGVRELALVVIALAVPWIAISLRARNEYVATIRKRLVLRRLDLEDARVSVQDPETIALLEETAATGNARQAAYALSLLAEARGYALGPQLLKLSASPFAEVRSRVYELAQATGFLEVLDRALEEIHTSGGSHTALKPAVAYVLAVAPDRAALAREFLNCPDPTIAEGAIEALAGQPEAAAELLSHEWLTFNAQHRDPERRTLAAKAVGVRGDQGTEVLHVLLRDANPEVAAAACRSAGVLRNRAYIHALVERLPGVHTRGAVIAALAQYGPQICGTLGDLLNDETVPVAIRRQVPRILKLIPHQRSVDVLLAAIGYQNLAIRAAVLKALNRLREKAPQLKFEITFVTEQIYREARYYFELSAALAPLHDRESGERSATRLLVRTLEERLRQTLERVFRLLGLRYPPKEIYSTFVAVSHRRSDDVAAAVEFLDNLLDRDLKRVLLPLLDAPEHVTARARDLFGLDIRGPEAAIRELIRSSDPWLTACAMAAAAELQLRRLAPDIARAAEAAEPDVHEVARSAQAVLV